MLASSAIIATVADTWRAQGLAGVGAAGGRSGVRVDARRPAAAPERAGFASHRTVSARNAGDAEPRRGPLLVDIEVVDDDIPTRGGPRPARARPAVGAGQGRAPAVVADEPRPAVRRHRLLRVRRAPHRHRQRSRRRRHAGRRGRQRAGPRLHRARRGGVRQALGDRMSARRIPVGPRPRPGVAAVPTAGVSEPRRTSRASRTSPTGTPDRVPSC